MIPASLQEAVADRSRRHIVPLSGETRARFQQEVDAGRDFVFLVHWGWVNEEVAWRTRYLQEHRYRRAVLPVWGAEARLLG